MYMNLQNRLTQDLSLAIANRENEKANFLKVIVAEMSRKESKFLSDEEVFKVLKMIKDGSTLLNNEFELSILSQYLPSIKSEEETKSIIQQIITEQQLTSIKDLGQVMKSLNVYGQTIDKSIASKYAKQFLNN